MKINEDFSKIDIEQLKSLNRKRKKGFNTKFSFSDNVELNRMIFIIFKFIDLYGLEETQKNFDYVYNYLDNKPSINIGNKISGIKLV